MTKINIKVWASQMCPGHTESTEVTKATNHPSLLNRKHGISLSLKKQPFVFNTPGFPGAYLEHKNLFAPNTNDWEVEFYTPNFKMLAASD